MPRVLTNNSGLAYSIESGLGVPGTNWFTLEPNEISQFGTEVSTVARDPISKTRQRRKGTITDVDSGIGFVEDLTLSSFRDFIEGFVFAEGINRDVTGLAVSAVLASNDSYEPTDDLNRRPSKQDGDKHPSMGRGILHCRQQRSEVGRCRHSCCRRYHGE